MDVGKAIRIRKSVRSFSDRTIPQSTLEEILDSARLAPSASNKQDWVFIVVEEPSKQEELAAATSGQGFIKQAPVILAGVATDPDYRMRNGLSSGAVDLAIALDHITLKAVEEGIGTCWIGAFHQDQAKQVLDIPNEYQIVALMPLGYPSTELAEREKARKDLEEITFKNTFGEKDS